MNDLALVVAFGGKWGSGHYHRGRALAASLGVVEENFLVLTHGDRKLAFGRPFHSLAGIAEFISGRPIQTVILDKRESDKNFLLELKRNDLRLICLDARGHERRLADYLINALPSLDREGDQNLFGPAYLPAEKRMRRSGPPRHQMALFFGDRDQRKLTRYCLEHLHVIISSLELKKPPMIHVFMGEGNTSVYLSSLRKQIAELSFLDIRLHPQGESFFRHASQSRLLICHFGLSAIYALGASIPVMTLNPTRYHQALSEKHFPDLNLGYRHFEKPIPSYTILLQNSKAISQRMEVGKRGKRLTEMIAAAHQSSLFISRQPGDEIIHRRADGNFRIHRNSAGLVSLDKVFPDGLVEKSSTALYSKNYFFQEYQRAYGRTYRQDRKHIYTLADARLRLIGSLKSFGALLDIGAALGYFLDRARDRGYVTEGVEMSSYACTEAGQRHRMHQGDFTNLSLKKKYDIITLWYVIEHLKDIERASAKLAEMQKPGGVLALSTPNGTGFSARFDRRRFFSTSPVDHYYVFNPRSLGKILRPYGYRCKLFRSTGIHYERFARSFPQMSKWLSPRVYTRLAERFCLGDTFEMYFVKVN